MAEILDDNPSEMGLPTTRHILKRKKAGQEMKTGEQEEQEATQPLNPSLPIQPATKPSKKRCVTRASSLILAVALLLYAYADHSLKGVTVSRTDSKRGKFVIVRPTAPHDADLLLSSFELWGDDFFPPCKQRRKGSEVDLGLSFSRMTSETRKIYAEIVAEFHRTNGWNHCFQNVFVVDANIPEELDKYNEEVQNKDRNWVNGPNTQFRSSFYEVQSLGYEAFFYMEHDTYPLARGWLDMLQTEIADSTPFGILGSKYKGHVWDKFRDQMPVALLDHISGNAIYNVSNPFLLKIVEELEKEQDTLYNAVSFDYRISQIYTEGSKKIESTFPFPKLVDKSSQALPSKMSLFQRLWNEFGTNDFIKESKVLAHFGVRRNEFEDIGDCAIVHGRQYNPVLKKQAAESPNAQKKNHKGTSVKPKAQNNPKGMSNQQMTQKNSKGSQGPTPKVGESDGPRDA